VVGALAVFGLSLLLGGARRTSRRGREARRGLTKSRRETAAVSQDRDDLISQRDERRPTVHVFIWPARDALVRLSAGAWLRLGRTGA
jgi:hypothetical protein